MKDTQMGVIESRFADMIWENEPVRTAQLVRMAEKEFGWKRTTTGTVIRRLCDKGIFLNTGSVITSLISREEYYAQKSVQYVEKTFSGSLPAFITAFTSGRKLTKQEADEICRMIRESEESES